MGACSSSSSSPNASKTKRTRGSLQVGKKRPNDSELSVKIAIVGPSNVGKTCCMTRYLDNQFGVIEDKTTPPVDFKQKAVKVKERDIKLTVMDTAGQERFRSITQSFYRGVSGCVLVFDVTDQSSFEGIEQWLNEVREYTTKNTTIILVGNKIDLKNRKVESKQGEDLAIKEGLFGYFEVSAKDSTNVNETFAKLLEKIVEVLDLGFD